MKRQCRIFLEKAISDINTAEILFDNNGDIEQIGFHIQQGTEKLLKALLSFNKVDFTKTHDIEALVELSKSKNVILPDYVESLIELTPFAVEFRYNFIEESDIELSDYLNNAKLFSKWVQNIVE